MELRSIWFLLCWLSCLDACYFRIVIFSFSLLSSFDLSLAAYNPISLASLFALLSASIPMLSSVDERLTQAMDYLGPLSQVAQARNAMQKGWKIATLCLATVH